MPLTEYNLIVMHEVLLDKKKKNMNRHTGLWHSNLAENYTSQLVKLKTWVRPSNGRR